MKIKNNFKYYFFAVVCSTAFFIHEFVPVHSKEYIKIVDLHSESKKDRLIKRNIVLESQKQTPLYKEYLQTKNNTDKLWDKVLDYKEEHESFLGFRSFQQFLGEFGWATGLLIYSVFNLSVSVFRNKKTFFGEVSLHATLIFISLYFISWAIQQSSPDYNKPTYVIYSFLMTFLIVVSTYFLIKVKSRYISHLKETIKSVFHFLYKDAEEQELINPSKNNEFRRIRIKLTNKAVRNE